MPGKPRSRKGSYSQPGKKKKRPVSRPVATAQAAVTPADRAVSPPITPRPASNVSAPPKPVVANPYIGKELGTISLLAVVMIVILFVLARVLS